MFPIDKEASQLRNVNITKESGQVDVATESATFLVVNSCVSRRTFQGCVALGWGRFYRSNPRRARSLKRYRKRSTTKTTPTTKKRKKKKRRRRRRSSLPRPE